MFLEKFLHGNHAKILQKFALYRSDCYLFLLFLSILYTFYLLKVTKNSNRYSRYNKILYICRKNSNKRIGKHCSVCTDCTALSLKSSRNQGKPPVFANLSAMNSHPVHERLFRSHLTGVQCAGRTPVCCPHPGSTRGVNPFLQKNLFLGVTPPSPHASNPYRVCRK